MLFVIFLNILISNESFSKFLWQGELGENGRGMNWPFKMSNWKGNIVREEKV